MRRRDFIKVVSGSAITWPPRAQQQPAKPIVGFLADGTPEGFAPRLTAVKVGLAETGFIEGQSVAIEARWARRKYELLPSLADDLVRRKVSVIVTVGSEKVTRAAKDATTTIPIVATAAGDPVKRGLVASINHPGGNLTVVSLFTSSSNALIAKRVELLHELAPKVAILGWLVDTNILDYEDELHDIQSAAEAGRVLGIDLSPALAQKAAQLAANEGLDSRVEFRSGDSRKLDLADSTFDAVVAHTLVSHVDDPLAVLREAARLVRPGGMIGIFDGDYASITFGHVDPTKGKAYDEAIISGVVTSPRVMRQMPHLLQAAGLQLIASFPYIIAEVGKADFWAPAIESFRRLVPKSGAMTEQEANAWADGLLGDSAAGVFFGASNYYGYVARQSRA